MTAVADAGVLGPRRALPAAGLLAYSLFALPLTMMALPVYVLVPPFYATTTGLALSTIGAVLLATRVLDAFVDPLLGAWVDRSRGAYLRPLLIAAPVLAIGYVLLFSPLEDMTAAGGATWLTLRCLPPPSATRLPRSPTRRGAHGSRTTTAAARA